MKNSYENLPEDYDNDGNNYCHGIVNCKYYHGECTFMGMGSGNPEDMPCFQQAEENLQAFREWEEERQKAFEKALKERPQGDILPVGTTFNIKPEDIKWNGGDQVSRETIEKIIVGMLEKWADGYCYIEIPTDDAIKEMKSAIENAPTVEVPENAVNCVLTMFGNCSYNKTGCSDCEIKDKIRKALNEKPQGELADEVWKLYKKHQSHLATYVLEFGEELADLLGKYNEGGAE